jgi:hypothetical protein
MFGRTGLIAAAFFVSGSAIGSAQTETHAGMALATDAAALTAPAAAQRTIATTYDASWSGFTALHISVAVRLTGDSYVATASLKPGGLTTLTGHLRKSTTYTAQSRGILKAPGVPIPGHYSHHGGKKNRQVDINFTPRDVTVSANPIFGSMGDPPASAAQRLEAVDSLSAIVGLITASPDSACARDIKVFDGRARYDVDLTPAGSEKIKVDGYKGAAVKCTIVYKRVAGFEKKKDEKPLLEKPLTIWFAPAANGLMAPAKISADSNWGPITITLKSLSAS